MTSPTRTIIRMAFILAVILLALFIASRGYSQITGEFGEDIDVGLQAPDMSFFSADTINLKVNSSDDVFAAGSTVNVDTTSADHLVIAGGEAKQGDADGWLAELQRQAKAVVLFGAARTTFEELLNNTGYSGAVHSVEAMAEAVPLAGQLAAQHHCRGVLLSPACASFDQYQDFEARGEHFRQLVQSL